MRNIWLQSLIITLFVYGLLWGGSKLLDLKLFTAFDVMGQALQDFHLTDYAVSTLREDPKVDQRIIVVNIGNLRRGEIAQQILYINQFKPKVIAIDALFRCEGNLYDTTNCPQLLDTLGNMMLANAIETAGNVVLGDKIIQKKATARIDTDLYDSIEYSDWMFRKDAKVGFVSLPTEASYQEDVKQCRSVFPYMMVNGKRELAFSTQVAMCYDSVLAKKYLARNNPEELINFRGNIEIRTFKIATEKINQTSDSKFPTLFYSIDVDALARGEVLGEVFKDQIVIMGFMGGYIGQPTWEDKFFTPMNKKVAGRANPDMFGVVLHANAVAMILNQDYINTVSDLTLIIISFITCFLTVALLIVIDNRLPSWFDALSFFVQLVLLLFVSWIVIYVFAKTSLSLDLTLTLATTALVGPSYDIFKSLQNEYIKRFTKPKPGVLTES